MELKIFTIHDVKNNHKAWVAAYTNINALAVYQSYTDVDIWDYDDQDYVEELPEDAWSTHMVISENTKGIRIETTFTQWMQENTFPDFICEQSL